MRGAISTGVAIALLAASAPAQTPGQIGGTDNDRAQLIIAKQAASDAEARAAEFKTQADAAGDEAEKARAQAAALQLQVEAAEQDIVAAHARIAIVARLQADQRVSLIDKQAPILRLVAALQTMARRPAALALAQPGSIDDIVHVRLLLADTLPVIAQRTAGLRNELARATQLHDDAERAAASLDQGRLLLGERRKALALVEATAIRRSQRLAEQAADEAQRALGLGEDARDIADRMDQQQTAEDVHRALDRLDGPTPRPAAAGDDVPRYRGSPRYLLPFAGSVAEGFGEVSSSGVTARGLTVQAADGAGIVAPSAGRIVFAGPFRSYGRIVIIDHGHGWTTTLTGLASVAVRVGDTVAQGQNVGRAGMGAPHVTAELRRDGRPIDILAMAQAG